MMPHAPSGPVLTRRGTLLGLAASWSLGGSGLALAATGGERRLVVVILRGAMDGMGAIVPYGDSALAGLRGALLPAAAVGTPGGLADLGGFFGMHPSLGGMHALYSAGELMPVHAVAGPTRSRSHFDAQDSLECGTEHRLASGWLNRAVLALPASRRSGTAMSFGIETPLLTRGPAPVASWAPDRMESPDAALMAQILAVSADDAPMRAALLSGLAERDLSVRVLGADPGRGNDFATLAGAAGRLLASPDGPRVAALSVGGWDTHQGQRQRLAAALAALDGGITALRQGLGPAWSKTVVVMLTEFGRTARVNGTGGTDHGTGSVAFLAGGAVRGGRVLADWPGLGPGKLLEDRDLQPTRDVRALVKAALVAQLGLSQAALAPVFPGSEAETPEGGLFA